MSRAEKNTKPGAEQGYPSHVRIRGWETVGGREGFSATIMWKFNHLHT